MIAFARLVGYIQYFHPSDQASNTSWEQFTEQGLVIAKSAVDSADLASRLNRLFQPVASTVRVFETDQNPPPLPDEALPMIGTKPLQVVAWQHHGFGYGIESSRYYSERIYELVRQGAVPSALPDPYKPFYADLGGGVSALIPLALFVEEGEILPRDIAGIELTPSMPTPVADEKTQRLAVVILAWNVFQHFYPYFDVVRTDWLSALRNALIDAEAVKNEEQFLEVLRVMVAQLQDGHGYVQPPPSDLYRPPFGWDWVENQLVITFVEKEAEGQLQRGDLVTAIDGQAITAVLAAQERLISGATPQWIRFSALKNLLEGPANSTITLTLQPFSGRSYQVVFKRTVYLTYSEELLFTEQRPPPVSELKPGIWYVDLTRARDDQFNTAIPDLTKAVGIIFDMRGYPFYVGLEPISHIIEDTVAWPQVRVPVILYPDHQEMSFELISQSVDPIPPHFTANIAFVTDGRAISYAETYMGIIESNKIADIVGSATAGTNGNVIGFTLFKKYTFLFTGMQVLKSDGSQHHGIGVQPTMIASRTLQGVREGRDELLERAMMIIAPK